MLAGCAWSISPNTTTNIDNTSDDVQIYWMEYALTQCNIAPWGKSTEPEVVTEYYSNIITVHAVEVTPPEVGVVFCQACGCPTGTTVSIQTDVAGQTYLLEQGFTAAGEALDSALFINSVTTAESQLADSTVPVTSTTTVTTNQTINSNTNSTEPVTVTDNAETELLDAEPVVAETLSEADASLRDRSTQVVNALAEYYGQYGSYPDDLAVLQLAVDLNGITYTPIGALPATYYDLAVAYTTGAEILNP